MDNDPILWQLILLVFLIIINAIFACAELAIISINKNKIIKLASEGNKKAKLLQKLTSQPARFLATIQVGITLSGFLASAFAANAFSKKITKYICSLNFNIPESSINFISLIIITLILSYFTLVFGELVPKRIGMKYSEKLGIGLVNLIGFISKIFNPIVIFLTISTNLILKIFNIDPHDNDFEITEEEIMMMVDAGSEKGTIDIEEKKIIHNIFEFDDKMAGDIMTHRTDVAKLRIDDSVDQWEKIIKETKFSSYPVCGESADDVLGILKIRDYFSLNDKSKKSILKHVIKSAYFVPETVHADILFNNMQKRKNHFAIVLDDYGGMSGIITINDLLEELVGNLDDDESMPEEKELIENINSRTWKINGSASIEAVMEKLGVILPQEDYDTFGGLVFGLLGTIPEDGSKINIEGYGLAIKIFDVRDHRLEGAIVRIINDEQIENKNIIKN